MIKIAIIAEYNPFHNGHKYQIECVRREFPQACIIALMSGNFVQRGEGAILPKYLRAEIAVKCGVNAVLELPYPYSSGNAEYFARGAIEILNSLGVDYLCFGSECGDVDTLMNAVRRLLSDDNSETPRKPHCLFMKLFISEGVIPSFSMRIVTIEGSMEPQREPMIIPSKGV